MDFEQWRKLASQDPDGFELMRHDMIEAAIDAASERLQQRLRGLQWRIDQVRRRSPSPMAACISVSNMMWESFAGEDGLAQTLNRRSLPERQASRKADVFPFPIVPKQ
ncbi:MAG: DUF3135 domain-containing protein [Pseudomonadota bacterium]